MANSLLKNESSYIVVSKLCFPFFSRGLVIFNTLGRDQSKNHPVQRQIQSASKTYHIQYFLNARAWVMCQFNIFHFCFWNRQLSIVLFLKTPSRSVTIFRPSPCYIPHSTPDSLLLKGRGASKYTEEFLQQTLLALLWSGAGPSPVNSSPPFNNMTNVQWKSNTVLYPISGGFILSRFDCLSIGYSCSDNQICSVKKLVLI